MIEVLQAKVYKSPLAKRRFFTIKAAISAEARAILIDRYPSESPDYGDGGRCDFPGWHWHEIKRSRVLHRRLCRIIKAKGVSHA